ncbi:hypothetical protein [Actinocorallia sp. A-T 12471]|uniref:hypothetical protein n=1 Tax=Actinocorallia sp. A-T 12471 TaxID=3089813 RepID=UPI0029CC2C9F|nr:hypothetical protein [Actinocorallia sp. A-T 12471]MDX6742096.1 hypothetical protein [Actinocorallia sp. A-T 12471]
MYLWIWRHLPVRHPAAKAGLSLLLVLLAVAALWYWVFPWLQPMLNHQIDNGTINEG